MPFDYGGLATGAVGSVVNGAFNLIGQGVQNKYNAEQAQIARDWEEKMMDKQNDFSLQMWNMTNEYNSPSEQIKRMREAGLNPMFYGLDGSSAQGLVSASNNNVSAPQMSNNPLADAGRAIGDKISRLDMESKQKDLIQSEVDKNEAQAEQSREEAETLRQMRPINVKLGNSNIQMMVDKNDREAERHVKELERMTQEISIAGQENERNWRKLGLSERSQQLAETAQAWKEYVDTANLSHAEKELAVAWYNAGTSRLLADSNIKVNNAQILKINAEGQVIAEEVNLKRKEVENYDKVLKQTLRNQKVNNVTSVINSAGGLIRDGAVLAGTIMSKGLAGVTTSGDVVIPNSKVDNPMDGFTPNEKYQHMPDSNVNPPEWIP